MLIGIRKSGKKSECVHWEGAAPEKMMPSCVEVHCATRWLERRRVRKTAFLAAWIVRGSLDGTWAWWWGKGWGIVRRDVGADEGEKVGGDAKEADKVGAGGGSGSGRWWLRY
jgi:hypothetical protein